MSLKLQSTDPQFEYALDSNGRARLRPNPGKKPGGPGPEKSGRLQRLSLVLGLEVALCLAAFFLTVWILEDGAAKNSVVLAPVLLIVFSARAVFLFVLGPFRSSLRHGSVHELVAIGKAVTLSSLVIAIFLLHGGMGGRDPLALLVMDWALCVLFLGALHFAARIYQSQSMNWHHPLKRIAVVGAGDAGATLVKELACDPSSRYRPTAIFDDNPKTHGTTICGVPVIGKTDLLFRAAKARAVDEVLICIPSATSSEMSRLFTICCQSGLPVRTLPTLSELVDGHVSTRDIRTLRIEDLLQRQEVQPDPSEVYGLVKGRVVLITGAGGSIGSELSRQIAAAQPEKLLLLDKTENSLFYIDRELRESFPRLAIEPLLIDVTQRLRVQEAFASHQPAIVFHAAAHKHVGLLELHPTEAIRNNVLGTRNVAVAAYEHKAERFVNISSDKAVNPENYMGLSKKLTELCIQNLAARHGTRFMNVRFGNVAGSTGSVVRLFWDHIQKGEPLHVTDPRATRFFMSIPEAVHLILRAAVHGKGGETFVLEMGEPINIFELAKSMSLLAGLAPGKELPIHFVGLRDGEKLDEELWTDWENPVPSPQKGIHVLEGRDPLANDILSAVDLLEQELNSNHVPRLLHHLNMIFPSFAAKRARSSLTPEIAEA
jgi:FlaA1/EpsC-like NDP-sugar epimerase